MAFSKKSFVFGVISFAALGLVACGDDSGNGFAPTNGNQVGSIYELGQCSAEREGVSVLVTDENTYYLCTSAEWKPVAEYNGPVSSSTLTPSSSSAPTEDPSSSSSSVIASSSGTKQSSSSVAGKPAWQYLNPDFDYGTMTDTRDGQVYKTVTIGTQTWMAENLNYNPGNVSSMGSYAWSGCYGEGSEGFTEEQVAAYCNLYGRLYTWEVAMNDASCAYGNSCNPSGTVQGVCPTGWRLPTKEEWQQLVKPRAYYVDDHTASWTYNGAGVELKTVDDWHEYSTSTAGTNASGFSALPAGDRYHRGNFYDVGYGAYFWSASEYSDDDAYRLYLYYNGVGARLISGNKYDAFSVRCVQNSN